MHTLLHNIPIPRNSNWPPNLSKKTRLWVVHFGSRLSYLWNLLALRCHRRPLKALRDWWCHVVWMDALVQVEDSEGWLADGWRMMGGLLSLSTFSLKDSPRIGWPVLDRGLVDAGGLASFWHPVGLTSAGYDENDTKVHSRNIGGESQQIVTSWAIPD